MEVMATEPIPPLQHVTPALVAEIEQLLADDRTTDQRWEQYAENYGLAASGGDPVARVRKMVRDRLDELQNILCNDLALAKIAASPQTAVALSTVLLITDKLMDAKYQDVDIATFSVLVAQMGIFSICAGTI